MPDMLRTSACGSCGAGKLCWRANGAPGSEAMRVLCLFETNYIKCHFQKVTVTVCDTDTLLVQCMNWHARAGCNSCHCH